MVVFALATLVFALLISIDVFKLKVTQVAFYETLCLERECLAKLAEVVKEDRTENRHFQYYSESGFNVNRAHPTDAGMDICSSEDYVLKASERHLFSTGIYGVLPQGTAIIVKPRSGLAVKNGIDVLAGVVDTDYTGEIKVELINLGTEDFTVTKGDRIAQLMLIDVIQTMPTPLEKNLFEILKAVKASRGENGFGSTGVVKKLEEKGE